MQEEMAMSEMNHQQQQQQLLQAQLEQMTNGTGTLIRPPIGGVPIFPPGAVSISKCFLLSYILFESICVFFVCLCFCFCLSFTRFHSISSVCVYLSYSHHQF